MVLGYATNFKGESMKKLFLTLTLFVLPVFAQAPSIPVRAFDVREANGIVDQGTTYPAALVIPFKDAAAETKFYQDYADNNNWANANPQPTKKKFALDGIKQFMKDQSQQARQKVAQAAVVSPNVSDLP
jgi:hypothetical protein